MKIKLALFTLFMTFMVSAAAAQFPGCSIIRDLNNDQYKSNSPVRSSSALTSPIVRFALNPTLIFVASNPATLSRAIAYDNNGGVLFEANKLGCAFKPRGTCLTRYKASESGVSNTKNARRTAIARTGSPAVIWKVSSTTCIKVLDLGKCYNVKKRELCNGTVS